MTEQVLINVKGLQFIENDDEEVEAIELMTTGKYYRRDGNKYLKYEESFEGVEGVTTNLIKIKEDVLEVHKKGSIDTHMVFEKGKKSLSYYTTPFGSLHMGIATTALKITESKDKLDIKIDYSLEMNDEYVADCVLELSATASRTPR